MPIVHRIEPAQVIHQLIVKSRGTYLIRYATENDDVMTRINRNDQTQAEAYVVLAVRVDDQHYHSPIMNYRLPLLGSNEEEYFQSAFDSYRNHDELPELSEECLNIPEETDWKIDLGRLQTGYTNLFSTNNRPFPADMRCDGNHSVKIFQKVVKNNERELSILKKLSYFHLVTFYGVGYESSQSKYLILANHGDSLKSKYPDLRCYGDLMSKQLAMFGYQIACGMMYLELQGVVHRDLHAENILIDEHECLRIIDFEHAIINDDSQGSNDDEQIGFKKRRLAPECLPSLPEDGESIDSYEILLHEFSSKSDVWAYGLIFIDLTIDTHEHIYPNLPILADDVEETIQVIQHIKIDREKHKRPTNCPQNFYSIVKQCWEYERHQRISFAYLRREMMKLFRSIHR